MSHTSRGHVLEYNKDLADRLYEQYAKPLESDHWGEYVAISPDGRTILGTGVGKLLRDAGEAFGPGNYVFKIGPRVIGRWV